MLFSFLGGAIRFELGARKRTSSHTPLEDRQACLSGAERGYIRLGETSVGSTEAPCAPLSLFPFWWTRRQSRTSLESFALEYGFTFEP